LKQHKAHLDERVLHLAVRLVGGNHGTEQSLHLPAAASGSLAFRDLIADLDVSNNHFFAHFNTIKTQKQISNLGLVRNGSIGRRRPPPITSRFIVPTSNRRFTRCPRSHAPFPRFEPSRSSPPYRPRDGRQFHDSTSVERGPLEADWLALAQQSATSRSPTFWPISSRHFACS
jgi:hypothetical protein